MNKKNISNIIVIMVIISSLFTACSNVANAKSNKETVKVENTQSQNSDVETYFTRKDGNLDQILIKEISTAQKSLDVAIYSLTKDNIGDAIIDAKKRGLDVKVITDKQESQTKAEKAILDKLESNGIPIKINSHRGLMHLKLTIADDKTACGGSYNYTQNATKENDENLIIMKDSNIVNNYINEFNTMWNDNSNYTNY